MMQVVELTRFGGVENFRQREQERPGPAPGEVQIALEATGLNPIDFKLRQGRLGGPLPVVLGQDLAGVVSQVGAGVKGLSVGDAVWSYLGGPRSTGAYAEYVCVPTAFVSKKPVNLSFLEAASVPMSGLAAYEAVVEKASVQPGQSVLITGASGGAGALALQLCRHRGAGPILLTAGSRKSFQALREAGVPPEHILYYNGRSLEALEQAVYQANGGRPVEVALDFVGHRMTQLCLRSIGFGGQVVSLVDEPAGLAMENFGGRNGPLWQRSGTLHLVFVAARALSGRAEDWETYHQNLESLRLLFELGALKPGGIGDLGEFSEASIQGGHQLMEEGRIRGRQLVVRFR